MMWRRKPEYLIPMQSCSELMRWTVSTYENSFDITLMVILLEGHPIIKQPVNFTVKVYLVQNCQTLTFFLSFVARLPQRLLPFCWGGLLISAHQLVTLGGECLLPLVPDPSIRKRLANDRQTPWSVVCFQSAFTKLFTYVHGFQTVDS